MEKRLVAALICCMMFMSMGGFAQGNNEERRSEGFERFKKERDEFFIKEMKLTDDEAKAFLPLAEQLQREKFEVNKTLREEMRKVFEARRENKTLTEADYKKIVELNAQAKIKEAELDAKYVEKFLKVISAEKVFLYQRAEQSFARQRMGMPGQGQGQRPQGNGPRDGQQRPPRNNNNN